MRVVKNLSETDNPERAVRLLLRLLTANLVFSPKQQQQRKSNQSVI